MSLGENEFISPDRKYKVYSKSPDGESEKVILEETSGGSSLDVISDGITKLQLKVWWSPNSSRFLIDMWFGTKGRIFVIYEKRKNKFVKLPIFDEFGKDFSKFDRDCDLLEIVKWDDDSKTFILKEEVRNEIKYYKCIVEEDRIISFLRNKKI